MLKKITKEFTTPKEVIIDFNGYKFYKKSLTCVYGLLGVGKSSLLLKLVDDAIKNKVKTIYIDSEKKMGSVGKSILQKRIDSNKDGYKNYFEIVEVKSVEDLFQSESEIKDYDLIILDSASHLLTELKTKQISSKGNSLMKYLRKLVVDYKKTIIFSAQAYKRNVLIDEVEQVVGKSKYLTETINYGGQSFRSETDESILIEQFKKHRGSVRRIIFEREKIEMTCDVIDGDVLNVQGGI